MKGKNLIMCGLCACIGFIGGEVRAYIAKLLRLPPEPHWSLMLVLSLQIVVN